MIYQWLFRITGREGYLSIDQQYIWNFFIKLSNNSYLVLGTISFCSLLWNVLFLVPSWKHWLERADTWANNEHSGLKPKVGVVDLKLFRTLNNPWLYHPKSVYQHLFCRQSKMKSSNNYWPAGLIPSPTKGILCRPPSCDWGLVNGSQVGLIGTNSIAPEAIWLNTVMKQKGSGMKNYVKIRKICRCLYIFIIHAFYFKGFKTRSHSVHKVSKTQRCSWVWE